MTQNNYSSLILLVKWICKIPNHCLKKNFCIIFSSIPSGHTKSMNLFVCRYYLEFITAYILSTGFFNILKHVFKGDSILSKQNLKVKCHGKLYKKELSHGRCINFILFYLHEWPWEGSEINYQERNRLFESWKVELLFIWTFYISVIHI